MESVEKQMQKMSDNICNVLGIPHCKIILTRNKVSRYNFSNKTIRMRSKERYGMLPLTDAYLHELSHHIQYCLCHMLDIMVTSHDNTHYMSLLSVLDFFEHKNYDWHHEYKSHSKRFACENNPRK